MPLRVSFGLTISYLGGKKMRVGRVVALSLCLTMVLAFLSACGAGSVITDLATPLGQGPRVQHDHPNPSVKTGDAVLFGGHEWLVLEVSGGEALVISEAILAERSFHSDKSAVTWETSELRQWLNGPFYDTTFTREEKDRIAKTTVKANNNPWYGTGAGNDTLDSVFLLCVEELVRYLGDESELDLNDVADCIDDQFNDARAAVNAETGAPTWWWLRSPAGDNVLAARVGSGGEVLMYTISGDINPNEGGVRPALWLVLE